MFKDTIALVCGEFRAETGRRAGQPISLIGIRLRNTLLSGLKNCMDFSIANRIDPDPMLCSLPVIIIQQSAQPLGALHWSRCFLSCVDWNDQRICLAPDDCVPDDNLLGNAGQHFAVNPHRTAFIPWSHGSFLSLATGSSLINN
jgi:hypothetical protein